MPWTHRSLRRQRVPQAPQWWTSELRSTQLPAQVVVPAGQTHWPMVESPVWPAGQWIAW